MFVKAACCHSSCGLPPLLRFGPWEGSLAPQCLVKRTALEQIHCVWITVRLAKYLMEETTQTTPDGPLAYQDFTQYPRL